MRVLLLSPAFAPPGGVQFVARLIAAALRRRYGARLSLDAMSLADANATPDADSTWRGYDGRKLRFAAAATRTLLRKNYDAVIVNHLHLLGTGAMGRFRRSPTFLIVHGIEAWRPLPRWRTAGLGSVRRVLYASDYSRRRAIEANPVLASIDGVVCHHSLLADDVPPAEARLAGIPLTGVPLTGVPTAPPFALMVGRMSSSERYKGFEEMIAAWPTVRRSVPDAELRIVGDGDDRARLQTTASSSAGIRFLGRVSDACLSELLAECRCFCLPSRGEGFGLVYLEAMRMGRPVLCGLDAGAEVVVDGVTGRAVDPADRASLASAATELLGDAGRRAGEAGQRRFLDRFTFGAYVERFGTAVEGSATMHGGVA